MTARQQRGGVQMSRRHIVDRIFPRPARLGRFNAGVGKGTTSGAGMNEKTSNARLMVADFAASVLLALSIGVVTSIALGSAVLLLAQQSSAAETTQESR
jgi:hypothetical protein